MSLDTYNQLNIFILYNKDNTRQLIVSVSSKFPPRKAHENLLCKGWIKGNTPRDLGQDIHACQL